MIETRTGDFRQKLIDQHAAYFEDDNAPAYGEGYDFTNGIGDALRQFCEAFPEAGELPESMKPMPFIDYYAPSTVTALIRRDFPEECQIGDWVLARAVPDWKPEDRRHDVRYGPVHAEGEDAPTPTTLAPTVRIFLFNAHALEIRGGGRWIRMA